ncbi:MAG: MFS transporter [Gammaproteobacteria bacterium]|nr:MFS transporter [Gammaproteobacteria bacterium]
MTNTQPTSIITNLKIYTSANVIRLFFLGFSAGLPILLVFSSLSFWLREAGVDRSTIGFISWVALAYGFKWVWSPAVDQISIPYLSKRFGRRKSWLLMSQCSLVFGIAAMAINDPQEDLFWLPAFAVLVAFLSATQDIIIDAFRIESGTDKQQAAMAATYQIGYRLAMIVASAGVLLLAAMFETSEVYDALAWQKAYLVMAALMLIGVITTAISPEPAVQSPTIKQGQDENTKQLNANGLLARVNRLIDAYLKPVLDLINRYKWQALVLIVLIATYRVSDIVMGVMANVFYVDMGYSKEDIAVASKTYGLILTLTGALVAGTLVNRFGVLKILLLGAVLSAVTNVLFIFLSQSTHNLPLLYAVISVDNLSAGLASTSFIAFLSSLANKEFTATQYAFLSSAMLLFPKFLGGFSGVWLDSLGYSYFFTLTALMGIPTTLAILYLMKKKWHA